nr:unnamed protein product [Digitaria exilis]
MSCPPLHHDFTVVSPPLHHTSPQNHTARCKIDDCMAPIRVLASPSASPRTTSPHSFLPAASSASSFRNQRKPIHSIVQPSLHGSRRAHYHALPRFFRLSPAHLATVVANRPKPRSPKLSFLALSLSPRKQPTSHSPRMAVACVPLVGGREIVGPGLEFGGLFTEVELVPAGKTTWRHLRQTLVVDMQRPERAGAQQQIHLTPNRGGHAERDGAQQQIRRAPDRAASPQQDYGRLQLKIERTADVGHSHDLLICSGCFLAQIHTKGYLDLLPLYRANSSTTSPNPNPIHAKPQETAMAGGEGSKGSSRSKVAKRKAEAMKEVVTTEEASPARDIPCVEDPIKISRWRCAHGHEYPTEETEELAGMKAVYLDYATKESLKDWQKEWFYAWNHQPQLPSRSGNPPIMKPFWRVMDQVRQRKLHTEEAPASEEPDEPHAQTEQQVSEEPRAKAGATSKRGEGSKRAASTELTAPVPKRARTLPKPRARVIPEEKTKISPQPKMPSSVGIAIGEIGTSRSQQSGIAQQPLSEEEIIHNIYNPVSAPFSSTIPVVEEPCPAGPSTPEQETEEEFTLGEPEILMRPSTMEQPAIDHAVVEPEAAVPKEPREMPETTLPEVQPAASSCPPVLVEAEVEETIVEVLADIEQLVTQAVVEETEVERRDQNSAEPQSVMKTSQVGVKAIPEAECSRGKQAETSTQEQSFEEIPRVPKGTRAEEEIGNFRIGSYDPMLNPNPQTFEYILDAEEDEEHIDRGLYHAERAVAYFKADRLQKELERKREDRKLQEAEDANMIRTLHLRTKELVAEKEDMKKKLSTAKSELKSQSKMTDWSNLANRREEALKTLSEEHDIIKEQLRVAVEQRKDADLQLIQIIEQQKKAAKDLEDAREKNKQLSKELIQARMSELEEAMRQMKKSDDDLAEALKRISLLEKAANPVVKALASPASSQGVVSSGKSVKVALRLRKGRSKLVETACDRRSDRLCLAAKQKREEFEEFVGGLTACHRRSDRLGDFILIYSSPHLHLPPPVLHELYAAISLSMAI